MRELVATLDEWARSDAEVGLATVVRTSGSTPRPAGARLAVTRDGRMVGSVSGGCLEGAVVAEVQATLEGRAPARILHYGISDEMGWQVGLSCGGSVDILVETLRWDGSDPVLVAAREAALANRGVALLSVLEGEGVGARAALVEGGGWTQGPGGGRLPTLLAAPVAQRLRTGSAGVELAEGVPVFVDAIVPAPHLAIVGAVDIATFLTRMAGAAGHRVTVIDPRRAFLTPERFPDADGLVASWPHEALPSLGLGPRDAAVCLAHDPKIEDPALTLLARSPVGYVGAIGSRKTHATRVARLREAGLGEDELARIHSPVGLALGAATPAEIAVAILAEMVAVRRAPRT